MRRGFIDGPICLPHGRKQEKKSSAAGEQHAIRKYASFTCIDKVAIEPPFGGQAAWIKSRPLMQ